MLKNLNFLKNIFGSTNQRKVSSLQPVVDQINALEHSLLALSDSELKNKTLEFKQRLKNKETIDQIMPEAFAVVREASKRVIGQRHFDVQLMGGLVLHQGKIAEMKTGEGKTLVATLPVYLNSLLDKGVHVVTVNDYLAKRDSEWMGKIYKFLGLTVGCLTSQTNDADRKSVYNCDVVYGTNNEFAFDYLRDNMKLSIEEMVQREFYYCIVDEVDSILIDEARTPLIISGPSENNATEYFLCNKIVSELHKDHYQVDEKDRNVNLTDAGIDAVETKLAQLKLLQGSNFYDPQNLSLVHHINQSLKANLLFAKDKDYIVRDNQVQIIDEFTGRVLEGRRYSDGLHQSIEAKEGVPIQSENQTFASITYQNYFRLYKKLSGMTGTAMTEAEELFDIYKLDVVEMPTNVEMSRKDLNDRIYRTENEKLKAIVHDIKEAHANKQPILVGTTSIEKSEKISNILKKEKITHSVLNAKQHEKEAEIIALAGQPGSVTIATNMAGRGTDIQLGGNLDARLKIATNKDTEKELHKKDKEQVIASGGLFVIGTERHESRRIDNQLRGRSGRQGDSGKSIFYLSLEDDLMRIFGSEKIDYMLQKLGFKEGESIDHPWINKALEKAQQKVESRNFDIRKTLLQFDDVMNDQRRVIYEQRLHVMKSVDIYSVIDGVFKEVIDEILLASNNLGENIEDRNNFKLKVERITGMKISDDEFKNFLTYSKEKKIEILQRNFTNKRKSRIEKISDINNQDVEKKIFLQNLDFEWRSHLQYLEQLRQVIGLRGYGQKNPLDEYKRESFELFQNLLNKIKENLILFLSNLEVSLETPNNKASNQRSDTGTEKVEGCLLTHNAKEKISRNEKCPATGKKFKQCCGSLI
jgi:preprotein translocase subunit SecA